MGSNTKPERLLELTYLEFYSGVGGWTMAMEEALRRINPHITAADSSHLSNTKWKGRFCGVRLEPKRLASFDHSHLCNRVFDYNFPDHVSDTKQSDRGNGVSRKRSRKENQKNTAKPVTAIEQLTRVQLQRWNAFVWSMSPPCQPYTRQHENQHEELDDPRNKSFLHLCEMIRVMDEDTLPCVIVLENVVGFEKSQSCLKWRNILHSRNYRVTHLHLTPPQVGIPNDRPRYYCIAIHHNRKKSLEAFVDNSVSENRETENSGGQDDSMSMGENTALESWFASKEDKTQIDDGGSDRLLEDCKVHTNIEPLGVLSENDMSTNNTPSLHSRKCEPISHFLDTTTTNDHSLYVSQKTIDGSASWCFDIVTPETRRSACFTHSYGRFIRGTGSVLYFGANIVNGSTNNKNNAKCTVVKNDDAKGVKDTSSRDTDECPFTLVPANERTFDRDWAEGIDLHNKLRYFSGEEMARLMGFPIDPSTPVEPVAKHRAEVIDRDLESGDAMRQCEGVKTFRFPPETTTKQKWKLLGNSLNVKVAARVMEVALRLVFP